MVQTVTLTDMGKNDWYLCYQTNNNQTSGIILCMRPANESWRYTVTPSLIGWAHTQNDPWEFLQTLDYSKYYIAVNKFYW